MVVGVLLLLWGVDTAARVAAEAVSEQRTQAAAALASRPEVQVRGLLFLPQLVSGRYRRVEVNIDEVASRGVRLSEVHADLLDVRVPFRDLIGGTVDRVLVGRSTGQALVRYEDLNRYLEQNGQPFTISAGTDGGAHVKGAVMVAGQQVPVGGDVTLAVQDGAVQVSPRPSADTGDPSAGRPLTFTLPLADLPYGQRLSGITAGPDGVQLQVAGTDVVLEQ